MDRLLVDMVLLVVATVSRVVTALRQELRVACLRAVHRWRLRVVDSRRALVAAALLRICKRT